MGSKRIVKWPSRVTVSFVKKLIRAEKDVEKAILVFDSATAEYANGFRHDHTSFGLIISRLLSSNRFRLAETMLERMKKEKCKVTEDIFLSICGAYGRVHMPHSAVRIFQKMKEFECQPTQKSYVTIFSILVDENQLKMAMRFYRYMREIGVPPTVASLNVLIKALCKSDRTIDGAVNIFREMPNRGCIPDSYTYGTLINGFCRLGKMGEAKAILTEMETKGCSPSVVIYTSLIHGFCQINKLDEALGLFQEMKSKNIEPNAYTYSSLMDGLCKWGHSSQAMELLDKMAANYHKPNMITYSTLIHGLCKEQKIQESVELLDRMKIQGLQPDAGLYSKIISGLCERDKFSEAANLLDEMVLGGIVASRVTWSLHVRIHNTVVRGLCTGSDLNRGFQLYLSMRSRGLSIESQTFALLADLFSKKGVMQKAVRVVNEMVLDGCIPSRDTWNSVVCGFCSRQRAEEATELFRIKLMSELVAVGTEN